MSHFSKVYSIQTLGLGAKIINIETDISKKTLYSFSIVGLPDKAIDESRDRIPAALKNSGYPSPKSYNQKTIVSLAPASLKKEGPLFDLAIAIGYLLADDEIKFDPNEKIFLGELSLDGNIHPIKGILVLVREAKKMGFKEIYMPKENAVEGALIDGIKIYGANTLKEVIEHINTKNEKENNILTQQENTEIKDTTPQTSVDFSDIRGQESAKRGLEIAATGRHNVAMYGPPGTGKTMLAKAFIKILPRLSLDEILEVTGIHSVSGILENDLVINPPFRSPHHTASYTSIVGGGSFPRPGEITLAHRGVLFLDEFPEFEKRVIESLRQPLEDRVINISRAKGNETFPANFILIATMNPCPCGNFGTKGKICICTPSSLAKYNRKLSGPIVDRIDIWIQVGQVEHPKLSEVNTNTNEFLEIKERVLKARAIQKKRFSNYGRKIKTNNEMTVKEIEQLSNISGEAQKILLDSAKKLDLSARSYHKVIKISRTIADMEDSEKILSGHILEALQYRPKIN
jgi:magnesium chelatase family protein